MARGEIQLVVVAMMRGIITRIGVNADLCRAFPHRSMDSIKGLSVAIAEMGDNIEFNVPMPIRSRCLVYVFCRHLLESEASYSGHKHSRY